MNRDIACEYLEINEENVLTLEELKRRYRVKALMFHPDKNKSVDAVSKFQQIQSSYEYLLKYEGFTDDDYDDSNETDVEDESFSNHPKGKYLTLLFSFLKNILREENRIKLLHTILGMVTTACEKTLLENLEKLDNTVLMRIYEIANSYKDVLHIETDILNKIEEIISSKKKNDECIILNPLIDDLMDNNLYKMTLNGNTIIVPLWHHDLIYDNSGGDINVKCLPILPDNVRLDEENNLHVKVKYTIQDVWKEKYVDIRLGKYIYPLEISLLKLREEQPVIFVKQGISKINTNSVYDVSKKSDVYIHVKLSV